MYCSFGARARAHLAKTNRRATSAVVFREIRRYSFSRVSYSGRALLFATRRAFPISERYRPSLGRPANFALHATINYLPVRGVYGSSDFRRTHRRDCFRSILLVGRWSSRATFATFSTRIVFREMYSARTVTERDNTTKRPGALTN